MVKAINVYFDEAEYKKLMFKKDGLSWHDFIMNLINDERKIYSNKNFIKEDKK